jgi:hypothetical protein
MAMTRRQHIRRDERGFAFVFVGLGFIAFLAATTLAIDVGMFMTARTQAQTSADAGALAGAVALVVNDFDNRTASGPAVQSGVNGALANQVIGSPVSVLPGDVTFPNDPTGQPTRVKVDVFRTAARANAVPTLMGVLFGVPTVDITASATAEATPANAETCVMPWTIPDKWIDHQSPPWDPDDTFTMYDKKGNLVANPDVYIPVGQPGYTGYSPTTDRGLELTLKASNDTNVSPSFYNPWDLPGSSGASDYETNVATCNPAMVDIGHVMTTEPGNMVGPTAQGTAARVAQDPNAYWDTSCSCVKGSAFGVSPRVVIVPLYDPQYYAQGAASGKNVSLKVANYLGFFVEEMQGDNVVGRITPVGGVIDKNAGPAPTGAFPHVVRLVQ